jgi:hypothetical protein
MSSRFDSSADTKLAATSDEVKQYVEKIGSQEKKPFSFITECFFLTLRSLHLGMSGMRRIIILLLLFIYYCTYTGVVS